MCRSSGKSEPWPSIVSVQGTNAMAAITARTAASTAPILARVRPRNIRHGEPIAFKTGLQEDLVVLLRVPERRRGVPRDDLGPRVHVGRRQLVADLLGDQAAERDLLLLLVLVAGSVSGLCRSVTTTTFEPDSSTYSSSASRRSGAKPVGVAGVDQVFARADHDLAEPGQLAHQVGPLLDDLLAADRLDHGPAARSSSATLSRSQPTSRLPSLTTA